MAMTLTEILDLTGKLDDAPGDDTARQRFRRYLAKEMDAPGRIRDHVEECLRNAGDQYSKALQDLVNRVGEYLGFTVQFGRYQGVRNEIGFDGLWDSPTGFHLVVETKTTDVYAIKTATLTGYLDQLISQKRIPNWDQALGLYVVGRPTPQSNQLAHSIIAERRTHQLRIISVSSLLSLAELMQTYDVSHEDVLELLRPSHPTIDPVVGLINRIVAGQHLEVGTASEPEASEPEQPHAPEGAAANGSPAYWLTPVATDSEATAEEVVERLVGRECIYAFGEHTPGRSRLKPGDRMCFYASGTGVVAHATVASAPEKKPRKAIRHAEKFPYSFKLRDSVLYLNEPVVIDLELRGQLEAFRDRDPQKPWSWLVQGTRELTEHDFGILTRGS